MLAMSVFHLALISAQVASDTTILIIQTLANHMELALKQIIVALLILYMLHHRGQQTIALRS
jgi:uncharacterized damage-inducible protein DinB